MKKYLVLASVVMALFASYSCTKEGVYNPKEKISSIYESSQSITSYTYGGLSYNDTDVVAKHLAQVWTWDGKLVSQIADYNDDGTIDETSILTYDGKRLVKVSNPTGTEYSVFTYDGKYLAKVETYENGSLTSTATIEHDGKKVVRIVITGLNDEIINKGAIASLLPEKSMLKAIPNLKATKSKTEETITFDFTWDGGNVVKAIMTSDEYTSTVDYTFDSKKNPYAGFYAEAGDGDEFSMLNKNNVLTAKNTMKEVGSNEEMVVNRTYEYEYDGSGFPTVRIETESMSEGIYSSITKNTTYFEY